MPQTKEKIILFIDEASALLCMNLSPISEQMQFLSRSIFMLLTHLVAKKKDQVDVTKKNQAFRAVRRALFKYKAYVTGLLTDTNSSVANLAPQLEHDPSVCIFGNP